MQSHIESIMNEVQVYKVCPRNRSKLSGLAGDKSVEITFQLLKPYFNKPLTEASEELGLSATAIKKACRKFGIPKWPFRTLTSRSSRNRSAFQAISLKLSAQCEAVTSPCSEESYASSSEDEQQQPSNRPVFGLEDTTTFAFFDDGFDEFARSSSEEIQDDESDCGSWVPAPLEIYCLEEAKETDLKSPKRRVSEDAYMSFLGSSFEEPTLESYDSELFDWNTGM